MADSATKNKLDKSLDDLMGEKSKSSTNNNNQNRKRSIHNNRSSNRIRGGFNAAPRGFPPRGPPRPPFGGGGHFLGGGPHMNMGMNRGRGMSPYGHIDRRRDRGNLRSENYGLISRNQSVHERKKAEKEAHDKIFDLKRQTELNFTDEGEGKTSLVVFFEDTEILGLGEEGKITISCPVEKRNEDTAMIISTILRPFDLRIRPLEPENYTSQWYLSNDREYKVKCLESATVSGPASQITTMSTRANLIKDLLDAEVLFTPQARVPLKRQNGNQSPPGSGPPVGRSTGQQTRNHPYAKTGASGTRIKSDKLISPLQALYDTCRQKQWSEPIFLFNRERKNGVNGFVFTVQLPQFNMVIGPNMNTWNQDREVARNLAAESCLNVVRAMSN